MKLRPQSGRGNPESGRQGPRTGGPQVVDEVLDPARVLALALVARVRVAHLAGVQAPLLPPPVRRLEQRVGRALERVADLAHDGLLLHALPRQVSAPSKSNVSQNGDKGYPTVPL